MNFYFLSYNYDKLFDIFFVLYKDQVLELQFILVVCLNYEISVPWSYAFWACYFDELQKSTEAMSQNNWKMGSETGISQQSL
jgi:hypothetical protein